MIGSWPSTAIAFVMKLRGVDWLAEPAHSRRDESKNQKKESACEKAGVQLNQERNSHRVGWSV